MEFLLITLCVSSAFALSVYAPAEPCGSQCKRENDCACASTASPIDTKSTPQFVTLTFDDSANAINYNEIYSKLLFDRKNPDGKPITATFYVTHQYTDYEVINTLYDKGYEISAHSVTKRPVDFWTNAIKDELKQEFSDNREIIGKFANIPIKDIIGARTPYLQINGDNTYYAYQESGFVHDSSFVTLSTNPVFPFTLEYSMNVPCIIGKCPIESHKGFWLLPIINLKGANNIECNALSACQLEGSTEDIKNWFIEQFNRFYNNNRAPMTLLVNSVFFQLVENSFEGLQLFLDYLETKKDVFLVSHSEVVAWSRKPVPVKDYKTNYVGKSQTCTPISCYLRFEEQNEERTMRSCVSCPKKYPWLGNVDGN